MNNSAMRSELLNIYTYLKYLSDTIDNLLNETPTEHIYQAAWLSKCLNLEEVLTIFQNQFINKREKFNLVLDKALKELNNDIDTKIQTTSLEKNNIRDTSIISHVNALGNGLAFVKEDLQKKFEITEAAIISYGNEIKEIKNYIQQELIPIILEHNQILTSSTFEEVRQDILSKSEEDNVMYEPQNFTQEQEEEYKQVLFKINENKKDKKAQAIIKSIIKKNKDKIPKWINYIDEVEQKMQERGWSPHEVAELAKINFSSFRKFQKKDSKLTNGVVNKILKLFDINY
jgi:hypothetical protein